MIAFEFGQLTYVDWILTVLLNLVAGISLGFIVYLTRKGRPKWTARKGIHVVLTTLIALTVPMFTDLTGILLAIGIFLVWLYGARILGIDVQTALLSAVTRERGEELETWLSSALGLIAFLIVLLNTFQHIEIFVSSVLSVGWGDGAGEIVGRTFGKKTYKRWGSTKSLEGSLAVTLGTFCGVTISYLLFSPTTLLGLVLVLLLVSVTSGIIESVCWSWTDNVFLPLVTSLILLYFTV